MAGEKRPEATHRERAAMGAAALQPVIGANGRPMAIVQGAASDLFPTVQFGNVLVGPVSITRWVEDDGPDSVEEQSRLVQQMAERICGSERRIIQWSVDPSMRIQNPSTGQDLAPYLPTPQPPTPSAPPAPPVAAQPAVPQPAPAGDAAPESTAQ